MLGASSIANHRNIESPVSVDTGTGGKWEQPLAFKGMDLPAFPVVELPARVSEYVRAVAETTQTSTDNVGGGIIGGTRAVCAG